MTRNSAAARSDSPTCPDADPRSAGHHGPARTQHAGPWRIHYPQRSVPSRSPKAIMKLTTRAFAALLAAAALTVLIGTIWTATSSQYTPTPSIIGAGVTIALTTAAIACWHESR